MNNQTAGNQHQAPLNGQRPNGQATALGPLVCPNGHDSSPGGRFCIRCGAQMVAWPASVPAPQMAEPFAPAHQQALPPFNAPAVNHQPQPGYQGPAPYAPPNARAYCQHCGGEGRTLQPSLDVCPQCRWLRPLAPGYALDPAAFQWAQDGTAMAALRSIGPLNSAAKAVTDVAGRKWVETTFSGVRLGEKQLPAVYAQAVRAARILGMPYLPDIYVSGERPWEALTFGSDQNAFIVLGSALVTSFQGDDLLFLLAREMGHCRAGHALWKTVIRFLVGEQGPRRGMMAGGVLSMLNPQKLIEGALEVPLLSWARQAEITADRAGLLAVGSEAVARRVLLTWALRSPVLIRQINVEAWTEQEADDGLDQATRLSELVSSATPYITRRLRLMAEFARSAELQHWAGFVRRFSPPAPVKSDRAPAGEADALRITCTACQTGLRIPRAALAGKESLNVRCPNAQCGKVSLLRLRPKTDLAEAQHNQSNDE